MNRARWNRREFMQVAASSLGAISFAPALFAGVIQAPSGDEPRFVYVGFGGDDALSEGIATFAPKNRKWVRTSMTATKAPSSLVQDARQRFLYVANAVDEHQGLPSGTVEAYAIDSTDGGLRFLNKERLSLSATRPEHLAITPDGQALIVSVHGGGAYNLLPLRTDGSLAPVASILKEAGSGPHEKQKSAHPQMVAFDRAGRAVSVDLGCDRLNVLTLDGTKLRIAGRHEMPTGEGPQQIAFHPNGRLLFVANGLNSSIACYEYDADKGKIATKLGCIPATSTNDGGMIMAIDPTGNFLYTSHRDKTEGISLWGIEQNTGALHHLQAVDEDGPRLHKMTVTSNGRHLLGLSREAGAIFGWNISNGQLERGMELARLDAPLSFTV